MNFVRRAVFGSVLIVLSASLTPVTPATPLPVVDCAALKAMPIYRAVNPKTGATLLTQTASEAKAAASSWGTAAEVAFFASRTPESQLVAVRRLYKDGDFAYEARPSRVRELTSTGYVDQGINFYAALTEAWCTAPLKESLSPSNRHQYTLSNKGPVAFYVATEVPVPTPPTTLRAIVPERNPADHEFTFAVLPDTQQEVKRASDPRFAARSQWLVDNRKALDLRWAIHTGDLVDWDTEGHEQYVNARAGLKPLIDAKVPLLLSIGNHDSQATGVGGGALDYRFTRVLARMTHVFNDFFGSRDASIAIGQFEPGKVDNSYTRIQAGGKNWLLLTLELWPRKEVIAWAGALAAKHKHDNVIVSTHSFISAKGKVSNGANYGSTTPKYLWDHLIKKYKNIKFVLCGHVGTARNVVKKGAKGNKIYVLLTTYHSNTTNPTRLVRINTKKNTVTTWVDAPWTNKRLLKAAKYTKAGLVN